MGECDVTLTTRMGPRRTTGGALRNRPRRPDRRGPGAARRTAALRAGRGNKAGGGQDIGNQACKWPGRIRDGTQQDEAKEEGDNKATREGEEKPKQDLRNGGNTEATGEGEDTPEPDQVGKGNNKAQGAGLGGNEKGDAAEGATRRKTEALGAGLSGTEKGSTAEPTRGGKQRENKRQGRASGAGQQQEQGQ